MPKLHFRKLICLPSVIVLSTLIGTLAIGQGQNPNTKLDLIAEVASVAEDSSFSVAVSLDPQPGWHVYWKNPGDNGTTPSATWTLPDGFEAGELQFSAPSFVPFMQFMSYGYDEKVLFISDIKTPSEFDGPIKIECSMRWLACDDSVCVPENGKVSISIPKGNGENLSTWRTEFETARAKQPQKVDWNARYFASEEKVELEIIIPNEAGEISDAWFFPAEKKLIDHAEPQTIYQPQATAGDSYVIQISSVAGSRWDRYEEIVGVLRTIPSTSTDKPQSFEFRASRIDEKLNESDSESSTRSPTDIKALSASH